MKPNNVLAADGETVLPKHILFALTAGWFVYEDGATQVFELQGVTVYTEGDRNTRGEWYLDEDGRFCSFWPPSYRACYDLHWIVEGRTIAGLRFTDRRTNSSFNGRYR
jgi:hypothetical protein